MCNLHLFYSLADRVKHIVGVVATTGRRYRRRGRVRLKEYADFTTLDR